MTEAATVEAARLLLSSGADPNAGYLWHGLTTPFTAVTGALGGGEGDQPAHPNGIALTRTLLAAGADPNDGQALYNRQFKADNGHLEVLLAHGLGRGDGGPWRARLGDAVPSPDQLLRGQLWWAIVHDMAGRVRMLAEYGADVRTPLAAADGRPGFLRSYEGKTPAEVAAVCGCPTVLTWLIEHGATPPAAEGADGLIAAVMAGDRATVDRLRPHVAQARSRRPGLIVWAAARRAWHAMPLLTELGFDVNALARSDVPMEQQWQTALHEVASTGEVPVARLLIDLGADPDIRDARFNDPPLGWAEHFGQRAMADFLRPLTRT